MTVILLSALGLCCDAGAPGGRKGKPLGEWKKGWMDIHAVNSARGECTFFVMPDGTTMVVDAGEFFDWTPSAYPCVAPKPSRDVRPYKVYADYIRHFMPAAADSIDYFVVTHYHMDHMGHPEASFAKDPDGGYALSGVTALYDEIPFRTLLDRSWPDYSEAVKTGGTGNISFYSDFVRWCSRNRGLKVEKFDVGSSSQIGLLHDADRYPGFKVTNYAGGGRVFDGEKTYEMDIDRENGLSCTFLVTYGPFEYFTSGDGNAGKSVKTVAAGIGHPIEAMKSHHHMSNPDSFFAENSVLKPRVIVTQSFYVRTIQPHQEIIKAIASSQDLFFTNIDSSLAESEPELYSECRGMNGHFVIRVARGGKRFWVFRLDDTDTEYRVKDIYGPYKSE